MAFYIFALMAFAWSSSSWECENQVQLATEKLQRVHNKGIACHTPATYKKPSTEQNRYKEQTESYLRSRETVVSCKNDTITFNGEINKTNVDKLYSLLNPSMKNDEDMILRALNSTSIGQVKIKEVDGRKCSPKKVTILKKSDFSELDQTRVLCEPKSIKISSEGGTLSQALRLYALVHHFKLNVEIPAGGICMSACTHLTHFTKNFRFAGDSLFMFHRPHILGMEVAVNAANKENCDLFDTLDIFWRLQKKFPESVQKGVESSNDYFVRGKNLPRSFFSNTKED